VIRAIVELIEGSRRGRNRPVGGRLLVQCAASGSTDAIEPGQARALRDVAARPRPWAADSSHADHTAAAHTPWKTVKRTPGTECYSRNTRTLSLEISCRKGQETGHQARSSERQISARRPTDPECAAYAP